MPGAPIAVLGVLALFLGWLLGFILPGARVFAWALLALGLAMLIVSVIVERRRMATAIASRRGRVRIGSTIGASLILGVVLFANSLSDSFNRRFDTSAGGQFTLTAETKEFLTKLDRPVEATVFFSRRVPSDVRVYARTLLTEYQNYTSQLTVREVDPDLSPEQARAYQLGEAEAAAGAIIFKAAAGVRGVLGPELRDGAEQAITSALMQVTGSRQPVVYMVVGHGEWGISAPASQATKLLRQSLFAVAELNLSAVAKIPDDCAVLAMIGPRQPIPPQELDLLKVYLREGGRLLLLFDPDPPSQLRALLSDWSLEVGDGVIADPESHAVPEITNLLVPKSRNAFLLNEVLFSGATSVRPRLDSPDNLKIAALAWTSGRSSLTSSHQSGAEAEKGPFPVGVLLSTDRDGEASAAATRLVVVGDSDFASDTNLSSANNAELLLGAVTWLSSGKNVFSAERRVLPVRRLLLTPEQARFLNLTSIAVLPLLVLSLGGYVWWRRRLA